MTPFPQSARLRTKKKTPSNSPSITTDGDATFKKCQFILSKSQVNFFEFLDT